MAKYVEQDEKIFVGPFVKQEGKRERIITDTRQTWEDVKTRGSQHYKGGVEPIDLMRDMQPHPSLSVLGVKALADGIKYCSRMLHKGANESDVGKVIHYMEMVRFMIKEGK